MHKKIVILKDIEPFPLVALTMFYLVKGLYATKKKWFL